ncbi:fungal-specific transcription factor domain-containing protein [Cladorrhinum sp. PSN259]|nr:fungal-specific transcription factor domain-containing protein [Cladorrhinum sp. PSN259]
MTAPINTPSTGAAKDAASARKRRRRAPAGGAADDCFTCAKRNVKCDRRRPYCSQCLEIGNECSGYKTQLTWGVGVASRGKLRGLSLPIAKAPPVNPAKSPLSTVKSPTTTTRPRNTSVASTTSHWTAEQEERVREEMEMAHAHGRSQSVSVPYHHHPFDMHMSPQESAPPGWTHIPFSSSMANDGSRYAPPRPLHIPIPVSHSGDMMHREIIHTPLDAMSDVDYMSPMAHSFPRQDVPEYLHSPIIYEGFPTHSSPAPQSPPAAMMIESPRGTAAACPSLVYAPSEPASSLQSHMSHVESLEAQLSRKMQHDCDVLGPGTPDLDAYSSSVQSHQAFWAPSNAEEEPQNASDRNQVVPWHGSYPSQSPSPVLQLTPDIITKMPFFMDYYEKSMCPNMVFIDGPSNPFREHILRLATSSRSLQHAICALAACNLRMKRRLSLGHHHARDAGEKRLDMSPIDSQSDSQPGDQSLAEEYQHRTLAVRLLDEQLNDAEKSTHDSVLATILLLCHYRMAESGVAKFHTQFAGVKKILAMRRMSPYMQSRDSAWMEALFTYFDAITASVNDREAQLNTSFYGVLPDAQLLPPGVENLLGCDRELFKTISKLGRLNLLSQHRPVQNLLSSSSAPHRTSISSRSGSPTVGSFKSLNDHHSHHHHHSIFGSPPLPINSSVRFDGNGFGSTLDDHEIAAAELLSHSPPSSAPYDDHRSTFWREWKEARIALQSWEFDANRVRASLTGPPQTPSSPPTLLTNLGVGDGTTPPPTSNQVRDLGSLSEAFRYASLLYTERLASPNVPSAHNNFRNLVSQVVYYATSLEAGSSAEKFLLWPLFVAGSECVNELQQNIVRSKCREIMSRSGYMNNLAALDVLERIWAGDFSYGQQQQQQQQQQQFRKGGPFSWIRCMAGAGDAEWIMF